MPSLRKVVGPLDLPVSVTLTKTHCHIDEADEDDLVRVYIESARDVVEAFVKMVLVRTIYEYKLDSNFPDEIILPVGPVFDSSLVSITYVDDAGATQTLATTVYRVSTGEVCRIRRAWGQVWPHTLPVSDAVVVTFSAGYPASEGGSPTDYAANVPGIMKDAILAMVADRFENRGNDGGELTDAWKHRLRPHQRHA